MQCVLCLRESCLHLCFYVCRPACFPLCASLCLPTCMYVRRTPPPPTTTTHECKHTLTYVLELGRTWVVIATQMSTKGAPGWTLSPSCPVGCNLSQCSHERQLFTWNESCFWEIGVSEGFDVSCLLLAWEWKPKPSREGEEQAVNLLRELSSLMWLQLFTRWKSLSPIPLNTLAEGQA